MQGYEIEQQLTLSRRLWLVLLVVFELAWCVYAAVLVRVVLEMFVHAPESVINEGISKLAYVIPAVLAISALMWAIAIYDIVTRRVPSKFLWILGFIVLGAIVLPIYFALYVWRPARTR